MINMFVSHNDSFGAWYSGMWKFGISVSGAVETGESVATMYMWEE